MTAELAALAEVRAGPIPPSVGDDARVVRNHLPERPGDPVDRGAGPAWLRSELATYPIDCYVPYQAGTKPVRAKGTVACRGTVAARRVLCVSASLLLVDDGKPVEPEWPWVLPARGMAFARWKKDTGSIARGVDLFLAGGPRFGDRPMLDLTMIARKRHSATTARLRSSLETRDPVEQGVAPLKVPPLQARVACLPRLKEQVRVQVEGHDRDELLSVLLHTPCPLAQELPHAVTALEHVLAHRWLGALSALSMSRQRQQLAALLQAADEADGPAFDRAALHLIRLRLQQQTLLGAGWALGRGLPTRAESLVDELDVHLHLGAAWQSLVDQDAALQRAIDLALRLRPAPASSPFFPKS